MKEITFNLPHDSYKVYIAGGLFSSGSGFVTNANISYGKALLVFDENVPEDFVYRVKNALSEQVSEVFLRAFPSGEENKNVNEVLKLASFAFQCGLTRKDCIFAVGGGVVSDAVGFLSSIYMRGIDYYCVPTTLLSSIDACAGGKNGVDLPEGKNLLGTFYNPKAVFCDTEAFSSLSKKEIKNALGECVKYALTEGGKLWKFFNDYSLNPPENKDYLTLFTDKEFSERKVFECLSVKKRFVEKDMFDRGERVVLNLGHTVGHAIEALSDYKLSHGECVAKGIVAELRASFYMGITEESTLLDVISVFASLGIGTENPFDPSDEIKFIMSDKKRADNKITIPIIVSPGEYIIKSVDLNEYKELLCR